MSIHKRQRISRKVMRLPLCALLLALNLCVAARASAEDAQPLLVTSKRLENADAEPNNWMSHGRTYSEQRYSPLDQINLANVKGLKLAWHYDFDDYNVVEATPLVADGLMFVTSAMGKVVALNSLTGREVWRYDPDISTDAYVRACCQPVNRGVALWQNKVFVGTLDGRLIALEAKTGRLVWEQQTVDSDQPYTITGAPRVVKGNVIIGNAGAEYGVRGYVSAYDAETGKMAWRFFTVPGDPKLGFENDAMRAAAKTWTGKWWKFGGGGTVWDAITYDADLDLLYIGTGNGSPWNHTVRSPKGGDNLYLSSIVALRPETGEYVWHYQTTPGDNWDFTATQQIVLADIKIGGVLRKVVMQAPKNGFFYVLDRETGKLISAKPFSEVNWASHVDLETGRPVELPNVRSTKSEQVFVQPGPSGAHNWNPMSFSPQTGLVYLPTLNSKFTWQNDQNFKYVPGLWNLGYDLSIPMDVRATGAERRTRSYLLAWDPATQKEAWRADGSGGGTLATGGGLVFRGTADGRFVAYDATSGREVWSAAVQNGGVGGPISYRIGDEQYIAIALGRGAATMIADPVPWPADIPHANRVLVFSLAGSDSLPAYVYKPQELRLPPDIRVDANAAAVGRSIFHRYCFGCHGREARGNKIQPDLRFSAYLDNGLWNEVVLDGVLKEAGMASFNKVLTPKIADAIRLYVISEAQKSNASIARQDAGPVQ